MQEIAQHFIDICASVATLHNYPYYIALIIRVSIDSARS